MRAAVATFATALADAWANRRSFWIQVSVMAVNDIAWVVFWVLFFDRVGTVRGWDVDRMMTLFAILTLVAGISLGLVGNARRLGHLAAAGELDEALLLPMPTLPYLLLRRVDTAMLGDIAFSFALFAIAGNPTPQRVALFLLFGAVGAAVLIGFLIAVGALTLLVGGRGEQADLGFQAVLILASYPLDVFGGATKLLLYTAVPAAFVSGLPASLVEEPDATVALAAIGAAVGFMTLGWAMFTLGLKRYASGSVWVR